MATIKVRGLEDQIGSLPEIQQADISNEMRGQSAALFLCALGFEPRCLALPQALADAGFSCERALYLEYQSNPTENDANRSALVSHLSALSQSVESMDGDAPDFTQRLRSLFLELGRRASPPRVVVDISVLGNRLAFKVLAVVLDANVDLLVIYAEAAIYHPTQEEYLAAPEKWGAEQDFGLERGVSNITISPEHPGQFLDLLPDFVMLFPAFNPDRSKAALEWIDPSLIAAPGQRVMWFVGIPHLVTDEWRRDAVKAHHKIADSSLHVDVSTFSYKDSIRVLHSACETYGETHNLTLVPLGSKLQAFGAALCCIMHPEVRVLFPVPRAYNALAYSEGTKATWKIPLGAVRKVRAGILDVGTLDIVDS